MKRFICLLLCLLFALSLTACGEKTVLQPAFDEDSKEVKYRKGIICENADYRLEWDAVKQGVILTELSTGTVWGTSPAADTSEALNSLGMPAKRHSMVESALVLYYVDDATGNDNIVYSYNGVKQDGHIVCSEIDNGLLVEYYFDAAKIMIPVEYVLCDNYVSITIDPTKIAENENRVTAVALAPMWCSAKNDTENSYLFIPSGSGALGDNKTVSQQGISYSEWIYGEDISMEELYRASYTADICLPVYGAKSGDSASFAIIESGAETASIEATSGSSAYGYSAVYPKFQLRGHTVHQAWVFTSNITESYIYTDRLVSSPLTVRFYPLSGNKANYSAMAECYRDYLKVEQKVKPSSAEKAFSIDMIGGSLITKSFLGVPYTTVYPTTSVEAAEEIVSDLKESTNADFVARYRGFGTTGIDIGKVAGGYKISNKIGSARQIKALTSLCREQGIDIYSDFEIMAYNSGGNGFSTFSDNATTAGEQKAYKYNYGKTTGIEERWDIYYLLSPYRYIDAAKKIVNKTSKWGFSGISLGSLSSVSYADYSSKRDSRYYARDGIAKTISEAIEAARGDKKFLAAKANDYVAVTADIITEAPTVSADYIFFSEDIPFYQMVFKGLVPMTCESINLSENPQETFLKAVEGGMGLGYTVTDKWDVTLIDSDYPLFYSSVYSSLRNDLLANAERLSDYYKAIRGSEICSHKILGNGVRITEFSNGVSVYTNFSNTVQSTPAGDVAAFDFAFSGGAE